MIFAVDPSTVKIGWCLYDERGEGKVVRYGVHKVAGKDLDDKLHDGFEVVDEWCGAVTVPPIFAIEMPVVHRNVKTAIVLAQMVGVLRAAAYLHAERVVEVLPGERLTALGLRPNLPRKKAKWQVMHHVNARFGLDLKPAEHDAADAIAVALAAEQKLRMEALIDGSD